MIEQSDPIGTTPPRLVEAAMGVFGLLREYFEGAIMVDAQTRISWIDGRYRRLLGLPDDLDPIGLPVEDILPNSMLRKVVETGRPILLDIMRISERQLVVCRIPLKDEEGVVQGAIGFVFYDNVDYLAPILKKVETLQKQLSRAQAALSRERQTKYSLSNFVGVSDKVTELKSQIRRFALRDGPALLLGETGTGKELLAHAIHQASDRAEGPFVAVNMAAIPEALLESEFFGVAPGAFTGADKKERKGKFELAHGGTLFLDEIGDMPLTIQAKFLRVLQEGEIEALGSNALKKIDVRIIAATSQDLEALMAARTFRADLYYRVAVLTINVPPLRERLQEIAVALLAVLPADAQQRGCGARDAQPGTRGLPPARRGHPETHRVPAAGDDRDPAAGDAKVTHGRCGDRLADGVEGGRGHTCQESVGEPDRA
jgi:transcriptional regulator with PAS, ATPase and Fis domain